MESVKTRKMKQTEYKIKGLRGNVLFYRAYEPDSKPFAVIIMIHGLSDHSGRYEHWAALFVQKGLAFASIDLTGHGYSEGKRGHASFARLYDDISSLMSEAENSFPGIPKILYGHSLGGNLVLNYYIEKKPVITGIIISSPWLKLSSPPYIFKLVVAKLIKYVFPSFTVNDGLIPQKISRDPEVVRKYINDKLVHGKISLRLFFDTSLHGKKVISKSYQFNQPVLLMHGTSDDITSCKGSSIFVRNTGIYTTFKKWDGCFHELHNEPNKLEIFEYIIGWLKTNFKFPIT
jgi:alpha-beta hydrolase superfamily lysophospholipase